ncbi:Fur family transcriptional regulator [Agrococcus versicolor]
MLRTRGLRVTRGRLAVLDVLAAQPHADADAIHRAMASAEPSISLQSVHNVLAALHEAGVLRRFQPARSAARYELRVDDNHHHAVCSRCGRVEDVDCVTGEAPCLHAPAPAGFAVMQAEVTFWGLCAACAATER